MSERADLGLPEAEGSFRDKEPFAVHLIFHTLFVSVVEGAVEPAASRQPTFRHTRLGCTMTVVEFADLAAEVLAMFTRMPAPIKAEVEAFYARKSAALERTRAAMGGEHGSH